MPWSHKNYVIRLFVNGQVIPISSRPLLSIKLLQVLYHCHLHFSYTDLDITYSYIKLDITSHISTLAFFREDVLCVLQSQGQAAYLIAGLREKTIYRSAPFWI